MSPGPHSLLMVMISLVLVGASLAGCSSEPLDDPTDANAPEGFEELPEPRETRARVGDDALLLGCPDVCQSMAVAGCSQFNSLEACIDVCYSWPRLISPLCSQDLRAYFQCRGSTPVTCSAEGEPLSLECDEESASLDACMKRLPY